MSLLGLKVFAALAITAVALAGGAIPLIASRFEGSRRFFSLGNAFAGGVFLGAGFFHLLPEGAAKLAPLTDYPLAELLATLGLALLLLTDRLLRGRPGTTDAGGTGPAGSAAGSLGSVVSRQRQSFYPYVLLLVLSVHSVTSGVALGLETHLSTSVVIMLAILFHKGSEAFVLIVSMHAGGIDSRLQRRILAVFVLMTPAGLFLGSAGQAVISGNAATLWEGGFDAFAAGTFIYIAILDIIDEELAKDENRGAKFSLIVAGLGFMGLLALWG